MMWRHFSTDRQVESHKVVKYNFFSVSFVWIVPTNLPTKLPLPGKILVKKPADVIGEEVLIDQGAVKANAIKRQKKHIALKTV